MYQTVKSLKWQLTHKHPSDAAGAAVMEWKDNDVTKHCYFIIIKSNTIPIRHYIHYNNSNTSTTHQRDFWIL